MRDKVLQKLIAFLQNNGFKVAVFSDFKSCFDIAASRKELNLLLKVLDNVDSLRPESASELKKLANVLNATPLIIGEKTKAFKLKDKMLYERHNIQTASFETFRQMTVQEFPEVEYFKGKSIVELDSGKLRNLRNSASLSLKEVAELLGASIESVYRFEQGNSTSLETAKKLEGLFGEKLIMEKNPFLAEKSLEKPSERIEDSSLKRLHSLGLSISVFHHAPFKAFSKNLEEAEKHSEPLMISKGALRKEIERKARVLERAKKVFDAHSMVIAKEFRQERVESTPVVLEKELQELKRKKQLLKILKEREG